MDVYLIQRGNFKKSDRKGIDGLLSFQYMGSSEFEFGALGESLKRIRKGLHNYTYETIVLNGRLLLYLHRQLKLVLFIAFWAS